VEVEIKVPVGRKIRFDESVTGKFHAVNIRVITGQRGWRRQVNTDYVMTSGGELEEAAKFGNGSDGVYEYRGNPADSLRRQIEEKQKQIEKDKEQLRKISQLRPPINWVADAPLAIGIVLNGENEASEAHDEGRVTERLLIGARVLGLGGGIAWFGDEAQQAEGERILGVPEGMTARGVVAIGYPTTTKDHRPTRAVPGRKPLAEIVSYDRYGQTK